MSIFSDNNDSGPDDDFEKFLSKQKEETVSKKRNSKEIERSDPIFEPDSQELDDSFEPEILPKKKRSSKHTEKIEPGIFITFKSLQIRCRMILNIHVRKVI